MPNVYKTDHLDTQSNFSALNPAVSALGNVTTTQTINHTTHGQTFTMTMTGATTFTFTPSTAAPAIVAGDEFSLIITQDATGTRVATWPSNFKKAGGALTLTTTASAVDVITVVYDGTNYREVARSLATS